MKVFIEEIKWGLSRNWGYPREGCKVGDVNLEDK